MAPKLKRHRLRHLLTVKVVGQRCCGGWKSACARVNPPSTGLKRSALFIHLSEAEKTNEVDEEGGNWRRKDGWRRIWNATRAFWRSPDARSHSLRSAGISLSPRPPLPSPLDSLIPWLPLSPTHAFSSSSTLSSHDAIPTHPVERAWRQIVRTWIISRVSGAKEFQ